MKGFVVVVLAISCVSFVAPELLSGHSLLRTACANPEDLSQLKKTFGEKAAVLLQSSMKRLCSAYLRTFNSTTVKPVKDNSKQQRELLDGLSGLFGENSQIGTLLKAANALSKAKSLFDEVKNLAPALHDHLKGGITDVHNSFQDLVDSIANQFGLKSNTTAKP